MKLFSLPHTLFVCLVKVRVCVIKLSSITSCFRHYGPKNEYNSIEYLSDIQLESSSCVASLFHVVVDKMLFTIS